MKSGKQSQTQLRVAMAQINPTVGALDSNAELILANMKQAFEHKAHIALFPEMAMTGYPVEDLALRHTFRIASKKAVGALAARIAAAGCGEIVARYVKHHLPNYGVFDEFRNFVAGTESLVVRIHGVDVGIAICEDIWRSQGPVSDLAARTPGLVLVPNGSPFERSKDDLREKLVKERARQIGASLLYVNMTGAQDDLVFDGDSIAVTAKGEVIARAPQFDDGLMFVDLELPMGTSTPDVVISQEPVAGR